MKRSARFWVVSALSVSLVGWAVSQFGTLLLQTPATAQTAKVPVSLPNIAYVSLADGKSNSGTVVAINAQTVTLQRGTDKLDVPLSQIVQTNGSRNVQFDPGGPFYEVNTGRRLMRIRGGSDDPVASLVGNANELGPIAWSQFRMVDSSKGYVEIDLPSGSSFRPPSGATSVADVIRIGNQISIQVKPWQAP